MRAAHVGLGLLLLAGCAASKQAGAPSSPAPSPAADAIGFSDFPAANTADSVDFAYQVIARDGNLAAWLWDDGVPWPEALVGAPYASGFMDTLQRRLAHRPAGHSVYVGITPMSSDHDGLALYRGDLGNQPLPPPWNGRTLDQPEVVGAYLNHCERMLAATAPAYFSYATEANLLYVYDPDEWPALLRLLAYVYPRLKAAHPGLPVFVTVQADTFLARTDTQAPVVRELLQYSDVVAVSTYPFLGQPDPTRLPVNRLAALRDLAPEKPFVIAETCWPAQDVGAPYPDSIPASADTQKQYVDLLAHDADALHARFVTWSFSRDYDQYWDTLGDPRQRITMRPFRNCGLYDSAGHERPGLAVWRAWLNSGG